MEKTGSSFLPTIRFEAQPADKGGDVSETRRGLPA